MSEHPWPIVVAGHSMDAGRYNSEFLGNTRILIITESSAGSSAIEDRGVCDVHLTKGWERVMTPTLAVWLIHEASKSTCVDESHKLWIKTLEEVDWV